MSWEIINNTKFELDFNNLEKDIIILNKINNTQLVYLKYDEKNNTYIVDEIVNGLITEINDNKKSITIYKNVAL
ncbi:MULTISPECIES: hypothetical protein [Staphylococcus]|uniref:Uncharacterized protein n=1 Tax=Staphylococcus warneri TaxID=1292 RepID=A0A2T4PXZ7_STAWA|nr:MULTISPECIES: hypothetical protein [Staphylococcus]EZI38308.1 hypothetical protein BW32_00224 [Staphylococcus haemolyticus]MBE7354928.1 hypothetical protein [Staphylococcus haemolyticus]MBF9289130.1 hypothetical protein [Staphylococcus haemolyticus]MCC3721710.1 hypothetical protein [Staphylococcus haemolyticus]MCE4955273.1 hypothetical protein [Staphylococcus haemolyticus]